MIQSPILITGVHNLKLEDTGRVQKIDESVNEFLLMRETQRSLRLRFCNSVRALQILAVLLEYSW